MKSQALYTLNKSSDDQANDNGQIDNLEDAEKVAYKKLLDNYSPRFMTNIGHAPITFDYEFLTPTRYNRNDANKSVGCGNLREKAKQPEMEVLSQLCESKSHKNIIKHPVIKSWIWLKWLRVRRYYQNELRRDLLLMLLMTWYVIQTFGGFEWNNRCERMNLRHEKSKIMNLTNFERIQW